MAKFALLIALIVVIACVVLVGFGVYWIINAENVAKLHEINESATKGIIFLVIAGTLGFIDYFIFRYYFNNKDK
ncbi:MAG TPA: hypothetical protein VF393_08455 [archaeon]